MTYLTCLFGNIVNTVLMVSCVCVCVVRAEMVDASVYVHGCLRSGKSVCVFARFCVCIMFSFVFFNVVFFSSVIWKGG